MSGLENAGAASVPRESRLRRGINQLGPLVGLVFVWVLFALLAGGDFSKWDNQRLMLLQTAVVGTAAVGATMIIISGGIDLSVGATIALTVMVAALLLDRGASPALATLGCVLTAGVCGLGIGALVIGEIGRVVAVIAAVAAGAYVWKVSSPQTAPLAAGALALGATLLAGLVLLLGARRLGRRLPLSPFIVTLGMWGALRGAAKGIGDNQPIYPEGLGWIRGLMSGGGAGGSAWLPAGVWMLLLLATAVAALLHYTRFGRHVYAVGSSELTARLCGISVERTRLLIYVIGVGCAGVSGLLQLSYLSMGDPTTAQGYELKVIAAVVIGGASLSGGEGSVFGALVGALIMTVVDNGCTKLGLDNWVQEIVTGAIIVVAVLLDRLRQRAADS